VPPALLSSSSPGESLVSAGKVVRAPTSVPRARFRQLIPELDTFLGGGLPRGVITEIIGNASSGKTTLVLALVASATRDGEVVAWVDLPNALDAECAQAAGIDLEHVLWVRPSDPITALRSAEQLLIVGGFRLVILDLDAPEFSSTMLPASAWLRMVHAVIRHEAAVVVLGMWCRVGTFAALSLEACSRVRVFDGQKGPCPTFEGMTSSLRIRKNKIGFPQSVVVDLHASALG
jgi:hypothetical protein